MTRTAWPKAALSALVLAGLCLPAAWADFELVDGQGRRILLKDDGTWKFVDAQAPGGAASEPAKDQPQAELVLERRLDVPGGCRFEFALTNTLPYEIRSFVPEFSVHRPNGVAYSAQTASFGPVRPGDQIRRAVRFGGIGCADIARLQVQGGDRCDMGDLNKFSDAKGECLARVRVLPSEVLPFEKAK